MATYHVIGSPSAARDRVLSTLADCPGITVFVGAPRAMLRREASGETGTVVDGVIVIARPPDGEAAGPPSPADPSLADPSPAELRSFYPHAQLVCVGATSNENGWDAALPLDVLDERLPSMLTDTTPAHTRAPSQAYFQDLLLDLMRDGLGRLASGAWFADVADTLRETLRLRGCAIVRRVGGQRLRVAASGEVGTSAGAEQRRHVPVGDDEGELILHLTEPLTAPQQHFVDSLSRLLGGFFQLRSIKRTLELTEAKARAILNTTVDAIVTIDETGAIQSFNAAAVQIFGYDESEVLQQNVNVLMPEPYRSEHDDYIDNYLETGKQHIIGIGREVHGRRKDGSTFPMDLAVSEVELNGQRIFTGIIRDITERRTLEREVLQASDRERRRIGQDMHDGLGQMLTGLGLISQSLAKSLAQESHTHAEQMQEITDLIKEADAYARGLARGLVPVELEMGGLTGALQRLAEQAERLFGIDCSLEHTGASTVGDVDVATHLYRIAQESLSNAVRHGKASQVDIFLRVTARQERLCVRDNGRGFSAEHVTPVAVHKDGGMKRGMGIRIMTHRARIIGATLDIQGAEGEGTVVTCTRTHRRRSAPSGYPSEGGEGGSSGSPPPGCPMH
jgi:two-component system, LuxR family, sensor kinase FixL